MDCKYPTLFQHSQRLKEKSMSILLRDIMINIITCDSIERLIWERKPTGITLDKAYITDLFCYCISPAEIHAE